MSLNNNKKFATIYFNDLNKHIILRIGFVFIGLISLILGYGPLSDTPFRVIKILVFLFPIIYFSQRFWFKNYVEWNSKAVTIKFHFLIDKTIIFSKIHSVKRLENNLKLTLTNSKSYNFDINNVEPKHISKLTNLLIKNSNAEFFDYRDNLYYEGDCCSTPSRT